MTRKKPYTPINIRFNALERKFIRQTARAQGHKNMSEVVKRLVRREMQAH